MISKIFTVCALMYGTANAQSLVFGKNYNENIGWTIDARLTNDTERTIVTNGILLPWAWNALELKTWPLKDDPAPKNQHRIISDLLASSLFLKPGKSMRGRIVLNDRFPFFKEQNAKYDMVVCYKYKYSELVPENENIKHGCFIFEKKPL